MKKTLLTEAALIKLQKEYDELILKRHEISEEIKQARGFGDLSENAEYHAAREAQSHNETEILKLKEILDSYELVQASTEKDAVSINSTVKIKYLDTKEVETIEIVTKIESDPLDSKISNESPIGNALMGKRAGAQVEFMSPNGAVSIEILEVI
ncbi:transcription elongation factor GreA [Fusibacter sp. 3D3]|uniref:transcription elongation factor GreA n=1 Tax=Fusibacter sp. 3D3 TaxID=1048380 RepID=UPI000853B790|nr:transcription elongation factor GreA [Fusibacter sp. 3D3]GAU77356.1 transcription elongation factor GreA [Fusibacter sp. 3D3]